MKKRIRIQGMLIFSAVILFIMFVRFVTPSWKDEPVEEFFDTMGLLAVLTGFLVRIVARGYKEEMSCSGNKLVISGPYFLMRNPMYFGTLMVGTGIISILLRLWTLPLFLIIFFSIYIPQVNREEKVLLARFGQEYKSYCKSVPKYFPDIRKLFAFKEHFFLLKLSWIRKELSSVLATIAVVFIIEIWQDIKLFSFEKGEGLEETLELSLITLIFIVIISILNRRVKK